MNSEFRKRRLFLISSVMALVAGIFVASYAAINIYGSTADGVANVTTSIGSRPVFSSTTTDDLSLNVSIIPYVEGVTPTAKTVLAEKSDTLGVSLTAGNSTEGKETRCSFKLIWTWNDTSDNYTKSTNATEEFTIKTSPTKDSLVTGDSVTTQLANKTSTVKTMVLSPTYSITATGTASGGTISTGTIDVVVTFNYIPGINQTAQAGKNYSGYLSIDNSSVHCEMV